MFFDQRGRDIVVMVVKMGEGNITQRPTNIITSTTRLVTDGSAGVKNRLSISN